MNMTSNTEEYRTLIEKIVKHNLRYSGNEDLLEDFCSETFQRSYKILSSDNSIMNLDAYLSKVASSAIIDVLKKSGRLRRLQTGYQKIITEPISPGYRVDTDGDIFHDIEDPSPSIEESLINQQEIAGIQNALHTLNSECADKYFLEIFKKRYIEEKKQSQIAQELNISQGEVSKRLVELAKRILMVIH